MWSGQRNLESIICSRSHTSIGVPERFTNRDSSFLQPDSSASASVSVHKTFVVFPLLFWTSSLDIHYTLKHFSWVPSHLRPVPASFSLMLLHASFISPFIACISFSSLLADSCVFIVFKKLYFLQGLQHLWHIRDGGSLLSFCQTHTHTQTRRREFFFRYAHIDNRLCSGIWKKYLGQMVGCCLYSFALLALVLMWERVFLHC